MDDRIVGQIGALGQDLCALWLEAGMVVWLRSLRLVGGGESAAREARLMVCEKLAAQQALLGKIATGELGQTPLAVGSGIARYVLNGVRANRRRLLRGGMPSPPGGSRRARNGRRPITSRSSGRRG
jgi:hypothetical protein